MSVCLCVRPASFARSMLTFRSWRWRAKSFILILLIANTVIVLRTLVQQKIAEDVYFSHIRRAPGALSETRRRHLPALYPLTADEPLCGAPAPRKPFAKRGAPLRPLRHLPLHLARPEAVAGSLQQSGAQFPCMDAAPPRSPLHGVQRSL